MDARKFSAAFYRALFDGATVPGAFQSSQSALDNRVRAISVLSQRTTADNTAPFVSQVLPHARPKCNFGSVHMQTIVKDDGKVGFIINAPGGNVNVNPPSRKPRRKD